MDFSGFPGFTGGKDQKMMGLRGTPHLELFFDKVPLEPVSLLGEEEQGFKLAMGALNVVRLAQVGARAVGKASHVLELMVDYASERKQEVLYLTERASFPLTPEGIELFEIAPGIDLRCDVLDEMKFAPRVAADLSVMPAPRFLARAAQR